MQITLNLDKGTIMFALGLTIAVGSLATAALAQKTTAPRENWEYKLVGLDADSHRLDASGVKVYSAGKGWEPISLSETEVLERRRAR